MDNHNAWLRAEIAQWLREGLISDQQAQKLQARYSVVVDQSRSSPAWGKIIFAALGVMVFGLGVVLLFAYNWEAMHRFAKLAVIALSIALSHGLALLLQRRGKQPRIAESLHLLGTMLFGAGIWLIAQIYHINAHFPNGFLLWALAALAMAWVLPSVAHGLLAALLIVLWVGLEVFEFQQFHQLGTWLLAVAILPLAWWQRAPALLGMGLLLFPLSYLFTASRLGDELMVCALWFIAVSYPALARLAGQSAFATSSRLFYRVALLILLPLLFLGSFPGAYGQGLAVSLADAYPLFYYLLPLLFAALAWSAALAWPGSRPKGPDQWLETAMLLLPSLLLLALSLGAGASTLAAAMANLVLLGYGLLFIYRGTESVQWKLTTLGCGLVAALAFARFNDLFESLLARSAVFLLLGGLMFLVGLRYARQSERQKIVGARHA